MNDCIPDMLMPTRIISANQSMSPADGGETVLEQQMAELGLSNDTKRFLRNFHEAEKQLNDAFDTARQGGELEQRVSQVYREMYGASCAQHARKA